MTTNIDSSELTDETFVEYTHQRAVAVHEYNGREVFEDQATHDVYDSIDALEADSKYL